MFFRWCCSEVVNPMQWFFFFFLISGFCSLVYQVAWLRMSMAVFGVTSTSVSIFLSLFMAGMALGSWGGGRLANRFSAQTVTPLRLYAAAEAFIALSGVTVAPALDFAHKSSLRFSGAGGGYLVTSVLLAAILVPFCACMGATFPLAIAAARNFFTGRLASSFSYLYVANVVGAMFGALLCAFVMIELFGFSGTIMVAAAMNLLVAVVAFMLSVKGAAISAPQACLEPLSEMSQTSGNQRRLYFILFLTGFVSLAMEVVWTRLYVPVFGPVVYTFAFILAAYFLATVVGSQCYRYCRKRGYELTDASLIILLTFGAVSSLLPLVATDARIALSVFDLAGWGRILAGLGPFCGLLGFMTPALLDRLSAGDPKKIGSGYALNMLGCIIGPIIAGFVLLPLIGQKWGLSILALSLLVASYLFKGVTGNTVNNYFDRRPIAFVFLLGTIFLTKGPEYFAPNGIIRKDHTATVVAVGAGMGRQLFVNGYGMTSLTPSAKMMVHLPMVLHVGRVNNGIVLCFGMGTSFRSMLTWGTSTKVVELVPSVPGLVPFYHADGEEVLSAPNGRIVIDDARRYLERINEKFDVIVVDPPPPVEAAASSLLYSKEFYSAVKSRLAQGGIFQQWIPKASFGGTDDVYIVSAMMKSICQSFPFVRTFYSTGESGLHILASMKPIPLLSPEVMAARLSHRSAIDLVEWGPHNSAVDQFREVLEQEEPVGKFMSSSPVSPVLTDDRPVNEYFWLRRTANKIM